jgi:predicted ATPase/DNA-binding winged helix-turn-helix (wHTH) protein
VKQKVDCCNNRIAARFDGSLETRRGTAMTSIYRFGSAELRGQERRLLVHGEDTPIGARAFDLLLALVERRDAIVTKNELLDLVWPGVVVEENNLPVHISSLRKVLGPQVIATVPGRGYRFTAALDGAVGGPTDASGPGPSPTPASCDETATPLTNLPAELPPLFGRAEDLTALRSLIDSHGLVTVVGAGGIGKTALAQALAHQLRGSQDDGVWLVELAPVARASLVASTVAGVLHVTLGVDAQVETLAAALRTSRMLILLDNCEHLLDGVAELAAALRRAAPNVRLLATSQESLKVAQEHLYRLDALALPGDAGIDNARQAGAVALFEARARAGDPRFELSEHNVAAVVDICRHLDGIPLAIELAAARVALLGVTGVRERLGERFRLLTAGSRLALRRHQTLRAALEWSYGLLSQSEQSVFDKLGVFAGSFSLESAQKLAADGPMDEWAVLDHLGALVDKSLVAVDGGSNARYRMLETTCAFALERLAGSGATPQTMHRHAVVMLDLFERFYSEIFRSTSSAKAVELLAADLDNMRGAVQWASEPGGDRRIAVALLGAAGSGNGYLHYLGLKTEAWHWCETLRPLVDGSIPAPDAARFWLACAELGGLPSPVGAIEDAKRAISLYGDLDDRRGAYLGWNALAYSLLSTGQLDESKRALDEALSLRDMAWPPWLRARIDNIAALVFDSLGVQDRARAHAVEYLAVSRQTGSLVDESNALLILVDLDLSAGNAREAAAAASEILARPGPSREAFAYGGNLRFLATALMSAGLLDEAEQVYREALPRVRQSYGAGATLLFDASLLMALRGRIDDAARVWAYADGVYASQRRHPRIVAQQTRDRLLAMLAAERPHDTLSRLYDEGCRLTDDAACALAFPPSSPKP